MGLLEHTLTYEGIRSALARSAGLYDCSSSDAAASSHVHCDGSSCKDACCTHDVCSSTAATGCGICNTDNGFYGPDYTPFAHKHAAVVVAIYRGPRQSFLSDCAPLSAKHLPAHGAHYDSPVVIMTSKSRHLRIHAGEISFPGGKVDAGDTSLLHTALRETREEIGLDIQARSVLGRLDAVETRNSGFVITPFVVLLDGRPQMHPNSEVDEILELPLGALLDTISADVNPAHDPVPGMHSFDYGSQQGKTVWGASALILKQLYDAFTS